MISPGPKAHYDATL